MGTVADFGNIENLPNDSYYANNIFIAELKWSNLFNPNNVGVEPKRPKLFKDFSKPYNLLKKFLFQSLTALFPQNKHAFQWSFQFFPVATVRITIF
jgi:hypothetical protein